MYPQGKWPVSPTGERATHVSSFLYRCTAVMTTYILVLANTTNGEIISHPQLQSVMLLTMSSQSVGDLNM